MEISVWECGGGACPGLLCHNGPLPLHTSAPQIAPRAFCTTKDWVFCIRLSVHDVRDCTRRWGQGLPAERSTKPLLGQGGGADSITMLIQEHLCQRLSCQNDFSDTSLCK